MKARLLVGLLTVALGGLTSCSNILEENGVINNVAESGMGELRINLTTDASLNVSTKGGEGTEPVNINDKSYDINTGNFDVTAVLSSSTANYTGKASEFPQNVVAGDYKVTATYDQMNGKALDWDKPSFTGSATVTIPKAGSKTADIQATLSNSIITFDAEASKKAFGETADISKVFVYTGTKENVPEADGEKFVLYDSSKDSQEAQTLFVAAGQSDVYIHIDGEVNDKSQTQINHSSKIAGKMEDGQLTEQTHVTFAANVYKIAYKLTSDKGELSLGITVSGSTQDITLTENIDPYPTTPVTPAK